MLGAVHLYRLSLILGLWGLGVIAFTRPLAYLQVAIESMMAHRPFLLAEVDREARLVRFTGTIAVALAVATLIGASLIQSY
jgi:hypothetical protein